MAEYQDKDNNKDKGEETFLIGYVSYPLDELLDILQMLHGHFSIIRQDSVLQKHFSQMEAYLWSLIQDDCDLSVCDIAECRTAWFGKSSKEG